MNEFTSFLISSIKITGLFDLYTYELPEKGAFTDVAIMYGDNGVGKTTVLKLVFHLLSPADDRNHRGILYKAKFSTLEVKLMSGVVFIANKTKNFEGIPALELLIKSENGEILAGWDYLPKSLRSKESSDWVTSSIRGGIHVRPRYKNKEIKTYPHGEGIYLEELAKHVPTLFILNADRRLDSDSVSDPNDEMELRKVMHYEEPKRISDLVVRSREIALSQAMASAGRWAGRKAIHSANQGSENVHSVYTNLANQLTKSDANELKFFKNYKQIKSKLKSIEQRTNELAKYEFAAPLSLNVFEGVFEKKTLKTKLAVDLLTPYFEGLEGRLTAVGPIYEVINKFVNVINEFLNGKQITFKVSQGFGINSNTGEALQSSELSSGEQQLLLLFSYVLNARDKPSVFMIDEPEISLNIKWQRKLIKALLDITTGANIQFIFASHSMELLSQYEEHVVVLKNKNVQSA